MSIQVTLLSSIAGADFPAALERQSALGSKLLDLKDGLWGQTIEQLDEAATERVADLTRAAGLSVDCFSTGIGRTRLTDERSFRAEFEPAFENALRAAAILLPRAIRLLPPILNAAEGEPAFARLQREFPWALGVYRDWIDRIAAAGCEALLENEVHGCLFSMVQDVTGFFEELRRPEAARYTWDVQNLWQSGVFPTLEVYRELRPFIGMVHLKGGRGDTPGGPITQAASLEDASWPVLNIVRAVVADGAVPVICLNPSHGVKPPDWDVWEIACRDLAFLRREIPEIQ